jgi:hypothetical protein
VGWRRKGFLRRAIRRPVVCFASFPNSGDFL